MFGLVKDGEFGIFIRLEEKTFNVFVKIPLLFGSLNPENMSAFLYALATMATSIENFTISLPELTKELVHQHVWQQLLDGTPDCFFQRLCSQMNKVTQSISKLPPPSERVILVGPDYDYLKKITPLDNKECKLVATGIGSGWKNSKVRLGIVPEKPWFFTLGKSPENIQNINKILSVQKQRTQEIAHELFLKKAEQNETDMRAALGIPITSRL